MKNPIYKTEIKELECSSINERYKIINHKSGLTVYLFPKNLKTFYALFGTKYGSVQNKFRIKGEKEFTEVPDGIAHYLEHKLFESEDGENADEKYAKIGAYANAFTSFLETAYLVSCTENYGQALKILIESVTSPFFTEENVEKERGIIAEEIRMGEDNPSNALFYGLMRSMYEKHNIRTEIAGSVESIAKITPELLYKCYNTFYDLSNMGLCICGRFDEGEIMQIIDSCLEKFTPTEKELEIYTEAEKPQVCSKRFSRKMDVSKPLFSIGIKDVDISPDPDERMRKSAAMDILCDMLFGRSSSFYTELYEKGLISQSLNPWHEHNKSFSMMVISGDSSDPEAVFDYFRNYVHEKAEKGIDELFLKDFERCRRVMYADLIKSFDSTEEIANSLLISFAFDDSEIFSFVDTVRNIKADYVYEIAKKLFFDDAYTLSVIYPRENNN